MGQGEVPLLIATISTTDWGIKEFVKMHSSSPSMVMEFSIGEQGNLDDQLSQLPTVGENQRKPLILYSYIL